MLISLILLVCLMILGAIIALESKDLLSGIISLGIIGFALSIVFLMLHAPDLAIVQIIIETLTLAILIAAILKTTRKDTKEEFTIKKVTFWALGLIFVVVFMMTAYRVFQTLPAKFGAPMLQMASYYIAEGVVSKTGANNFVAGVILDFRAYDTLGEATVLFTSVAGVVAVLRKVGRKRA
jgi:multicomponent Na+:H+ antiporter subunit B